MLLVLPVLSLSFHCRLFWTFKVERKILENISIFHFLYFYSEEKRSVKSDKSSAIWEIFLSVKSIPIYKFTRTFFSVSYSAKFLTCTSMIVHTGTVCDHPLIDYESENSRFQGFPYWGGVPITRKFVHPCIKKISQ